MSITEIIKKMKTETIKAYMAIIETEEEEDISTTDIIHELYNKLHNEEDNANTGCSFGDYTYAPQPSIEERITKLETELMMLKMEIEINKNRPCYPQYPYYPYYPYNPFSPWYPNYPDVVWTGTDGTTENLDCTNNCTTDTTRLNQGVPFTYTGEDNIPTGI